MHAAGPAPGPLPSLGLILPLAALLLPLLLDPTLAGICWSAMGRNGRCTDLLSEKVSKEECCATHNVATAWSSEDMDAGTLFFWRTLHGGVSCFACKESCAGVHCSEGKKCVVRKGRPKCICSPGCRGGKNRHKMPVCGTDGRDYANMCRLRRHACRSRSSTLAVAYYGRCQNAASCETVQCRDRQSCLVDMSSGAPRCVTCNYRCPRPKSRAGGRAGRDMGGPICGSNNRTYPSWCHMLRDACSTGYVIETKHSGTCERGGPKPAVINTVLDDAANINKYS